MSSKIRLGILGGGGDSLIGVLHRVASSMFDRFQLVGGSFNPSIEESIKFANQIGIPTDQVYKGVGPSVGPSIRRFVRNSFARLMAA